MGLCLPYASTDLLQDVSFSFATWTYFLLQSQRLCLTFLPHQAPPTLLFYFQWQIRRMILIFFYFKTSRQAQWEWRDGEGWTWKESMAVCSSNWVKWIFIIAINPINSTKNTLRGHLRCLRCVCAHRPSYLLHSPFTNTDSTLDNLS